MFSLYLALGAGVFARIEGWGFTDGVYWADYTLLTVGLGSDFPLTTTLGRMLLIPYAAIGITMIGLVISSVRGLVLERAKAKVVRRFLGKERQKWKDDMIERQRLAELSESRSAATTSSWIHKIRSRRRKKQLSRQLRKRSIPPLKAEDQQGAWHRAEFELMRFIQISAESAEQYTALYVSLFIILVVWIGGSLIFWSCEMKSQQWSYVESLFFSYTTLLTIGYGDFYPASSAGKPFFVVWSLISVPAMTVLISNMGDTVIKWVRDATLWASRWTILPERLEGKRQTRRQRAKTLYRGGFLKHNDVAAIGNHVDNDHDDDVTKDNIKHNSTQQRSQGNKGDNADILEHDVEELGGAVEQFEEDEGRPGSTAAVIAREIAKLAKDLNAKPPKKYSWPEWKRWLELLGKREEGGPLRDSQIRTDNGNSFDERAPTAPVVGVDDAKTGVGIRGSEKEEEGSEAVGIDSDSDRRAAEEEDWCWTWLGDEGPLFSRLSETEWIIEKLCFRLEKVLEDEIREARTDSNK